MAFLFKNPIVLQTLKGEASYPIYNFLEIRIASPLWPEGVYLTDFTSKIEKADGLLSSSGTPQDWHPHLLGSITTPARTGNITQEIQKVELKQGLGYQYTNFGGLADIVAAMGDSYHNADTSISSYIYDHRTAKFIVDEPIMRTNGLIKSVSRNIRDESVVIEISNSFGKLDGLNELRTTPGSLERRNKEDTSFAKAGTSIDRVMLKWGVDR